MKKFHTKNFLGKFSIAIYSVIALAMLGLLSSCQSEEDLDSVNTRSTFLEFNITMPLASVTTSQGYENGTIEENSISNYRIYIYDTNNTYIMSLDNPTLDVSDTELNTIYTITAEITDNGVNPLEGYSDFKIVMLANWETYTEPEAESTIDDLCNSEFAQYSAFASSDFNLATSGKHIPYYGVHQYTNVTFPKDGTVSLDGKLTLLRAMAKVEIVIDCEDDEDDNITLSSATLYNYNSKGYCAPSKVYSQDDYGQATDWASDYTGTTIHLVDNKNDSGEKTLSLYKVQDKERDASGQVTQKETWIAYVPEYNNQGTDFSYIDIKFDHQLVDDVSQDYKIYFAVYDEDGTTKAYDSDDPDEIAKRRDIHRNNLYRFNVDFGQYGLIVNVQDWEQVFENDFTFGELSHVIFKDTESTDGPGYFWVDGVMFYSQVDKETYQEGDELSAYIKLYEIDQNQDSYTIPNEIYYLGYTYTITGIGSYCFQADTWLSTIVIPSSITYIGSDAFYGDSGLTTLVVQCEEPPTCESDAFEGDDVGNMLLYVPVGTGDAYEADNVWGTFKNITEVPM